jgi:hypothetical protein
VARRWGIVAAASACLVCALVLALTLAGGGAASAPASTTTLAFGFNSQLFDYGAAAADKEAQLVAAAGGTVERIPIHWSGMQPAPQDPPLPTEGGRPVGALQGEKNALRLIDASYLDLTSRGIRPIIVLGDAPMWSTAYALCQPQPFQAVCRAVLGAQLTPDNAHLDDWQRFVTAVAARYPAAVIEPWNEPNIDWGVRPSAPSPEHMARVACVAHLAVRDLDASRPVLSPGLADRGFDAYLTRMEKTGARNCWNGYSWHLYFGSQTDFASSLADRLAGLRAIKAAYGDRAPIWVTEAGWTTSGPFAVGPDDQASALVRLRAALAGQPDVRAMLVHTLRDAPVPQHSGSTDPEFGYGVLNEDWSPKPAYTALAH